MQFSCSHIFTEFPQLPHPPRQKKQTKQKKVKKIKKNITLLAKYKHDKTKNKDSKAFSIFFLLKHYFPPYKTRSSAETATASTLAEPVDHARAAPLTCSIDDVPGAPEGTEPEGAEPDGAEPEGCSTTTTLVAMVLDGCAGVPGEEPGADAEAAGGAVSTSAPEGAGPAGLEAAAEPEGAGAPEAPPGAEAVATVTTAVLTGISVVLTMVCVVVDVSHWSPWQTVAVDVTYSVAVDVVLITSPGPPGVVAVLPGAVAEGTGPVDVCVETTTVSCLVTV